jgi:uncharacterized membrane protein YdjX (TVP38/TMEM64 family)
MTHIWQWIIRRRIQFVAITFWILLILGIRQYMQVNDLTFTGFVQELQALLTGAWFGPLIYIVVYLLRPLILFPASLLTVLAGSVFGLWLGFVYGLIAGTLSAFVPYGIGRWISQTDRKGEISEDDRTFLNRFVDALRENPFQSILTMRLLYMPYDTVSFAAGILRIAILPFILATGLGNIFGTFAFVGIGASIEGDITRGQIQLDPVVFILSAIVLVMSFGLSWYLKRQNATGEMSHGV